MWWCYWRLSYLYEILLANGDYFFSVYIHRKEDQLMVSLGDPPIEITVIHLEPNRPNDTSVFAIRLTEKQHTSLSKEDTECKNYENGENFNLCSQKSLGNFLDEQTSCTLPGILNIIVFLRWSAFSSKRPHLAYSAGKRLYWHPILT